MAQPPGTLIEGKYEILGKIREGGMGAIYKVRHRLLDEIRVVKVMRPQVAADEELKRRFVQEAKTATRLKHPNIGTIHDFALDEDGTAYLVMEFIEGVNFAELLALKGCPETGLALEMAHQALLALGYLHRRSVVHRDIAPDNLMLTHDQEGRPLVKLIDLGIAKALDKPIDLTLTGVFLGKLRYASPEQYGSLPAGEKLDGRSDLYCLGLVFYELLTGKRPFPGETAAELLKSHLMAPPLPFSVSDPDGKIPKELQDAILKALEKKREDRFQSAEDFDREILTIRQRFAPPERLERTVQVLSAIRPATGSQAVTVTPSAQNRLNLRFAAKTTPHPSQPPLTPSPADPEKTKVDESLSKRRQANRRRVAWVAAAAVLVALGALVAFLRPRAKPGVLQPGVPAAETPRHALSSATEPQSSTLAAAPTAAPTPEPEAAQRPAPAEENSARLHRDADDARGRADRARQKADHARAAELATGLYDFGRAQEKDAQRLFGERNDAAARQAFEAATSAFERAEASARKAREKPPTPVERVAVLLEPTARPEPSHAALVVSPPEPTRAPSAPPAAAARPTPSEQDKIREVLKDYERAQNTLDVGLYARVYPSLSGEARQSVENAWQQLKSQQFELEIRQIELNNSRAVVRAYQRLVAVPRIGSEQHDERSRVFTLEKRGDSWIIAGVS